MLLINGFIYDAQAHFSKQDAPKSNSELKRLLFRRNDDIQTGDIISDANFQCTFNNLDDGTRAQRLDGLRQSGYAPQNADEAAVFLAHVYHETGGLTTLTESCAPGKFHITKMNM